MDNQPDNLWDGDEGHPVGLRGCRKPGEGHKKNKIGGLYTLYISAAAGRE